MENIVRILTISVLYEKRRCQGSKGSLEVSSELENLRDKKQSLYAKSITMNKMTQLGMPKRQWLIA